LDQFGRDELTALISINDYLSFTMKYLASFAIIFQLPLIMLTINSLKPLPVKRLLLNFRYVLLISFVVSAILTPTPDLINQTIMATPILLLYLISVAIVGLISISQNNLKSRVKMV
jgi:sec-independent protein translocase protein TatC